MRFAVALALLPLAYGACGGRIENGSPTTSDASTNDFIACGDAGSCAAATDFCRKLYADGGLSYACEALPNACHACECAAPPKIGEICSCTSDGDQILVSCTQE